MVLAQVPRPVVVDGGGGDGEHRQTREHGEDRHEKEHGALRERIADRAGGHRDGDIARMVEGRVPPHAPGQLLSRVEAQGQRRDRRAEHVADHGHQAVGDRDRPERRHGEDDDGAERQHRKRQDDRAALGAGLVDRRADRRLDRKAEQAADGGHQADLGLAPMLLGDQEDVQIGAERAAHIGEQEIDGVERARPEACGLAALRHSSASQQHPKRSDHQRDHGQRRADAEIVPEADHDPACRGLLHHDQIGDRAQAR